jgi:hypothetical protein
MLSEGIGEGATGFAGTYEVRRNVNYINESVYHNGKNQV